MIAVLTIGARAAMVLGLPAAIGLLIFASWLSIRAVRERKRLDAMAADAAKRARNSGRLETTHPGASRTNAAATKSKS